VKIKVWVLSGVNPEAASPKLARVFSTQDAARAAFEAEMREEWDRSFSYSDDPDEAFPGAVEAQERLRMLFGNEQGLWDVSACEIDVPEPPGLVAALRHIAARGPDDQPEAEDYHDTESAFTNGTECEAWEAAVIAHNALVGACIPVEAPEAEGSTDA
jgi:hypothetical protein